MKIFGKTFIPHNEKHLKSFKQADIKSSTTSFRDQKKTQKFKSNIILQKTLTDILLPQNFKLPKTFGFENFKVRCSLY